MKGFVPGLALKQRRKGTLKLPLAIAGMTLVQGVTALGLEERSTALLIFFMKPSIIKYSCPTTERSTETIENYQTPTFSVFYSNAHWSCTAFPLEPYETGMNCLKLWSKLLMQNILKCLFCNTLVICNFLFLDLFQDHLQLVIISFLNFFIRILLIIAFIAFRYTTFGDAVRLCRK